MMGNSRLNSRANLKLFRVAMLMSCLVSVMAPPVYAQDGLFTKPIEVLTQFRDRPLFSPSRRAVPVAVPVEADPAPIAAQPLNAVLLGVVSSTDGTGVAILRIDGQGDAQRVRIGDSVNGWQLDRIESRSAVFSSDGQSVTLTFSHNNDATGPVGEGGVADMPIDPGVLPTPDPTEP